MPRCQCQQCTNKWHADFNLSEQTCGDRVQFGATSVSASQSSHLFVGRSRFVVMGLAWCSQNALALSSCLSVAAVEGDLRLVNEERVENWVTGGLQIFLDGEWGQVCRGLFQGRDADVACRQLGFGAGTQVVFEPADSVDIDAEGTPEVVLTGVGCTGTEARLFECAADDDVAMFGMRQCASSTDPGLKLACVVSAAEGVPPHPVVHADESCTEELCTTFKPYMTLVAHVKSKCM